MAIYHTCPKCKADLHSPESCAGRRARCPNCSEVVTLPEVQPTDPDELVQAESVPESEIPQEPENNWNLKIAKDLYGPKRVHEYLDSGNPNTDKAPAEEGSTEETQKTNSGDWMNRMFTALLDPRSIHWLLTLGGGIMVLGGLIWLISWGVFESPLLAAIILGVASLAVLGCGGAVELKTKYKTAGRALAFLGCVFVSLNLWFYHAQGLLQLQEGLWMAGVVCVLIFVGTVWLLKDPLFMYAVQAGITLTAVLILGDIGIAENATPLSVLLMTMALISIHAHKAFPAEGETFTQDKFGLPLFWSGHVQLASALIVLFGSQLAGSVEAFANYIELPAGGILLTESRLVPGILWLVGAYAYLYSDLVVRKIGLYIYLGAMSLVMCVMTFVSLDLVKIEGVIATLAIMATTISLVSYLIPASNDRYARTVLPLALILSIVPVALGLWLHLQATSVVVGELGFSRDTSWIFVGVMLLVTAGNRVSAFLYQRKSESLAAVYLIFAAGALVVAAAGSLRMLGVVTWYSQAPWLMVIPIGYIIASRLWRGESPERPVAWVAHATTILILGHVIVESLALAVKGIDPIVHLNLAIVLGQASIFYALAAMIRKQSVSSYAAVAAGCAAIWQLMLSYDLPLEFFTTGFALVGLALIIASRWIEKIEEQIYSATGEKKTVDRGQRAIVLQSGHAILSITLLVALMKGLAQLAAIGLKNQDLTSFEWLSLGIMTAAGIVAAVASRSNTWRRVYTVATVGMAGVSILTINMAIDLSIWRKTEIFLVVTGLIMLGSSYVGRFREEESKSPNDTVSLGLWLGSMLTALPLLAMVFYYWKSSQAFSLYDEVTLIAITLMMVSTGVVWRVKASTLFGGGSLFFYLCVLIISLVYQPQIAIGIYLTAGGGMLFGAGLLLAFYRDYLLELPERVANREGVFEMLDWK
ncbi:MAG: hypothetical protein COA78_23435 [Blastopirellula sp.]|nr:MAG: hypothetical protein COA78_23435 [Blastopirellula sp.]